jgi:hypothetical protein
MCHDWWMRHERRRQERFDEELRYLLDEREHSDPPAPIAGELESSEVPDELRRFLTASTT